MAFIVGQHERVWGQLDNGCQFRFQVREAVLCMEESGLLACNPDTSAAEQDEQEEAGDMVGLADKRGGGRKGIACCGIGPPLEEGKN